MKKYSTLLDSERQAQLERVRAVLDEAHAVLSEGAAGSADSETLRDSLAQLDDVFLLVIVGEFNAGKSALINALLGEPLLTEGVTPTTTAIQVLRHTDQPGRPAGEGIRTLVGTAPMLRQVHLVDTPGTNAITREHEILTEQFVPRADLILFTTSVDRPFTESEHRFLERIREWGKNVVVVVNKIDILASSTDLDKVIGFIEDGMRGLLGFSPQVFPVSAKRAFEAKQRDDPDQLTASGLSALEDYILTSLDDRERFRLKLLNPVGVALRLVRSASTRVADQLQVIDEDLETVKSIQTLITDRQEELSRGVDLRMAEVDEVLSTLEREGHDFIEETVRIGRLPDLLNRSKLKADFERLVIKDQPKEIERRVDGIISWLVASDLQRWQAVREQLVRRRTGHAEQAADQLAGSFEADRARLLDTVGKTVQETLNRHDQRAESARMADSVQNAVANAALLEVGAVGLGTVVSMVATSTAADVTGTLAAGLMATLGFFVIPRRRRRAKQELRARIAELRNQLGTAVRGEFEVELAASGARINDALRPYLDFVQDEHRRLDERSTALASVTDNLVECQRQLGATEVAE